MDMHFEGILFQTHAEELARRVTYEHPPAIVLDVRPAASYAAGHIPGARSISVSALANGLPEDLPATAEITVYGEGPGDPMLRRASLALRDAGARRIVEFPGGLAEWRAFGHPIEKGATRAA